MFRTLVALLPLLLLGGAEKTPQGSMAAPPSDAVVSSRVSLEGEVRPPAEYAGPVVVRAYRLRTTSQGRPLRPSKGDILGGSEPAATLRLPGPGVFRFGELEAGYYAVLAFLDRDGDGVLGFDPPDPMGWHADEPAGPMAILDLRGGSATGADIVLQAPHPFPREERRTQGGSLRWIKGMPVLQLHGTARERGFAHGFLVGEQILDFFRFYVLEDSWQSARRYGEVFVPFLETHFDYDSGYLEEVGAVVEGMRASGIDMEVEWLGRDFEPVDLLAINAYIERRATQGSPTTDRPGLSGGPVDLGPPLDEGPACSQFALWGEATAESELEGGLIAGRNMDGEVDLRKVTVSHFLLFAVDPEEPGLKRWVSTMWPGFVGTLSGINEDGLYSMENAGPTGPGPVVDGLTPCTWVQRYILERAGSESTPESVAGMIDGFRSAGGGTFGAGSVILWGVPFRGQADPAFVSEGDRFGTAVRGATRVPPVRPFDIMATNHYLLYGADPDRENVNFGEDVSFSSAWRYEVGKNTLEAWHRIGSPVGTEAMRRLLQAVAHGTTEYAVIFRANEMSLDVAVDDLAPDLWDAPYQRWTTFRFEELFQGMRP